MFHHANAVRRGSKRRVDSTLSRMLPGMTTINSTEAQQRLQKLSGWTLDGAAIRRQFTFGGFPEAVAFVVRVGFAAEAVDHHPDILVNYKRVTLTYSTHSAGGLTEKDFAGAEEATRIAAALGGGASAR
jgi:4a-hydroxytetrahydrobiopterin dehydratase